MAKKKFIGTCHICGTYGALSFEHVPPRAAFNDRPVLRLEIDRMWDLGPDDVARGPLQQRGMGAYTLCGRCNNNTGTWYGDSFVGWCHAGMSVLRQSAGRPTLLYLNYLLPLRILKQLAAMFFSVNSEQFRLRHPDLVAFVLDKERRYLPPMYRFWVYYNVGQRLRNASISAMLDIRTGESAVMSEITFPPFGYMLTLDSRPLDDRLFEITHFSRYGYYELAAMPLQLPVLPTHTLIPGDYRTKEQIYREARI